MPIPTKWKLVAGSVTAVVGLSTAAAAVTRSEPEELDLDDVVAVTEVVAVPTVELAVEAPSIAAVDADDSLATPFDSPHDSVDTDGDGITDIAEAELGTDPKLVDTDGDGFSDYDEVAIYGTDPTIFNESVPAPVQLDDSPHSSDSSDSSDSPQSSDSSDSSDSPQSSDSSDSSDSPESPDSSDSSDSPESPDSSDSSDSPESPDSPDHVDSPELGYLDGDGDGLSDIAEATLGTNPGEKDSDFDELNDGEEVLRYGTDPGNPDTDEDGFTDGDEVDASTDPLDETDYPGLDKSADSNDSSD